MRYGKSFSVSDGGSGGAYYLCRGYVGDKRYCAFGSDNCYLERLDDPRSAWYSDTVSDILDDNAADNA